MQHEAAKYLEDIAQAAELIERFTAGKSLAHYLEDPMLRAAVERQFEIIGEALIRLTKRDAAVAVRISEYQRMVAFRNVLIHAYSNVDDPSSGASREQACRVAAGRCDVARRAAIAIFAFHSIELTDAPGMTAREIADGSPE